MGGTEAFAGAQAEVVVDEQKRRLCRGELADDVEDVAPEAIIARAHPGGDGAVILHDALPRLVGELPTAAPAMAEGALDEHADFQVSIPRQRLFDFAVGGQRRRGLDGGGRSARMHGKAERHAVQARLAAQAADVVDDEVRVLREQRRDRVEFEFFH